MFAVIIILFMIVGFTLCGLWAHSGTAKQRRTEAAAAEAAARRRYEQEQQRAEARQKRQQEAEQKQQEAEAKRQQAEQRRQARRAQQEADRAAKLEAAREMAELKERQLAAARELVRVQMMAYERRGTISIDDTADAEAPQTPPEDAQEAPTAAQAVTLEEFAAAHAEPAQEAAQAVTDAPKPFAGQAVAFTGRLSRSGMTRREAAEKVRQAGGRAYDKGMPAGTTLLVVGDKPGMCKMDKADEWIGQVRKITEAQFLEMFAA